MSQVKYAFLVLALALCVGCSGNVKLSGTVVYSDDNTPVETGMIYFTTPSYSAHGSIVDGQFTVSSVKENDGLPPGEYDVYFSGVERVVKEQQDLGNGDFTEAITEPSIDEKYLSASTSGLHQKVDKTTRTVEFKLDRK